MVLLLVRPFGHGALQGVRVQVLGEVAVVTEVYEAGCFFCGEDHRKGLGCVALDENDYTCTRCNRRGDGPHDGMCPVLLASAQKAMEALNPYGGEYCPWCGCFRDNDDPGWHVEGCEWAAWKELQQKTRE